MAQVFRTISQQHRDGGNAAQMYYARKRRRARAEATAGRNGGGLREQMMKFGVTMTVRLTLA